jgi:glycosyltransferase involved in cell wall biosynthesis
MLSRMKHIEHNIEKVMPGDVIVVKFATRNDENYRTKKMGYSSGKVKEIKHKSVSVNVDLHIHLHSYEEGIQKRQKIINAGIQNIYTAEDGSAAQHRIVFVVPNFDVDTLVKSCVYMSTDSLYPVIVNDIEADIVSEEDEEMRKGLVFVSTWGIRCGIATYTGYLVDAIKDQSNSSNSDSNCSSSSSSSSLDIDVESINEGMNIRKIYAKMCHLQHEFGIMPSPPRIHHKSKCLITFHTVMTDTTEDGIGIDSLVKMGMGREVKAAVGGGGREMGMKFILGRFESKLEGLVGYIVHTSESKKALEKWTDRDVWVVPHGSYHVPVMSRDDARKMLEMDNIGVSDDDKVAFVFGFQSPNKNYNELIDVAKKTGLKLVISGAKHGRGIYRWNSSMVDKSNVIFLEKFLTEIEVSLYALAADVLLFDYTDQDHYSVSGALHRIIGSGRPCIVPNTRHFLDVKEWDDGVLKFRGTGELEEKVKIALDKKNNEKLGKSASEYAIRTSWENVAKMHLDIYSKYVDFDNNEEQESVEQESSHNE